MTAKSMNASAGAKLNLLIMFEAQYVIYSDQYCGLLETTFISWFTSYLIDLKLNEFTVTSTVRGYLVSSVFKTRYGKRRKFFRMVQM